MRFADKIVVVTGSASGIGAAVALAFAREGARVVVNCRSNMTGAAETAARVRELGREALIVQADVSDPEQAASLINQAATEFGGIDVLVNNAGSATAQPFSVTSPDHWMHAFAHNLFSAVWCSQAAAPLLQARGGGAIINTASIRGVDYAGRPGLMAYSAAKAALISFTKTLARELAPAVTVNAVAPGFVRTRNYDNMTPEQVDSFIAQTQLRRFIEPEEIASAYLYLAASPSITGHVLVVDGGFLLK